MFTDTMKFWPRRCIWSHPPAGGAEMVTRFHGVPLGASIHGHTGMDWLFERSRGGPAFAIRVMVDGAEVGRVRHDYGDGWKGFDIALGPHGHRVAEVEFRASPLDSSAHVCFEADTR